MLSTNEIWRPVHGFEGMYEVSNAGRVRSLDRYVSQINNGTLCKRKVKGIILKHHIDEDGYHRVSFRKDGKDYTFGVHRLVAQAFIPNPHNKPTVNHKNGDKDKNTDDNLEWATVLEQNHHAIETGLREGTMKEARKASKKKLSRPVQCIETGVIYPSMIEAERQLGLGSSIVWHCIRFNRSAKGLTFKFVEPNAIN